MKSPKILYRPFIALPILCFSLHGGAASFTNLNFEAADVPVLNTGQFLEVTPEQALPGWNALIGTHPATLVGYNGLPIGSAAISLLGPNFYSTNLIPQGRFSTVLTAAFSPQDNFAGVDVSLSQAGLIPNGIKSITFLSSEPTVGVSVDGASLSLTPLLVGGLFTRYGVDVTSYAGQQVNLKFTSFFVAPSGAAVTLDDIRFSTNPIPEPSSLALLALAGVGLAWRLFPKTKARKSSRHEAEDIS